MPTATIQRSIALSPKPSSVCSSAYLAEKGTNGNFILKHAVGNKPGGTEIDVPLTYADYYFVEALLRYKKQSSMASGQQSVERHLPIESHENRQ